MTSIAAARVLPIASLTSAAVDGHPVVGRERGEQDEVDVVGLEPGDRDRARAGDRAPSWRSSRRAPATRRSRMPVRVTIHSSDVSTIRSRSALVRTRRARTCPSR